MNKSLIKFITDFGPLLIFFVIYYNSGKNLRVAIPPLIIATIVAVIIVWFIEKKIPYIVILTDPTTGGVSASFAMLGDITFAEPGALIGFAGPRVIQSTVNETLPEGFQTAEYLLEHGMIDDVIPRKNLKSAIANTISLLRKNISFINHLIETYI